MVDFSSGSDDSSFEFVSDSMASDISFIEERTEETPKIPNTPPPVLEASAKIIKRNETDSKVIGYMILGIFVFSAVLPYFFPSDIDNDIAKLNDEIVGLKRDFQLILHKTMKERKEQFKRIKCLEDIPEDPLAKWVPDASNFQGVAEFISDQQKGESVKEFMYEAHVKLNKVRKNLLELVLIRNQTQEGAILLRGACVYENGNSTKVFVQEGKLYVSWKYVHGNEKKRVTMVYTVPEEHFHMIEFG
ncbi:hypothetical protein CRE_21147 [Caenorhabditis remanei]|uniref:Uncharacterized protein n=1 Tax=Caenorhabditis remanei TaxID=31234 RepID=E3MEZ8_CAERE|nr:hypothetical protein CRE_21147 [Caenorhabditis remanei]